MIARFAVVLALFFAPAFAAVTIRQVKNSGAPGVNSTATLTFTSALASGTTIAVALSWESSTGNTCTISSVADTVNTYTINASTKATQAGTHYANVNTEIAYASNTSTSALTVTATMSRTDCGPQMTAWELQGGTVVLDQILTGVNANTATPSTSSITPSAAGTVAICAGDLDNGFGFANGWFTAGSGWTLELENGGGNQNAASEDQTIAGSGAVSCSFVSGFPGTTGPNAASIANFKISGGGGGATPAASKMKKLQKLGEYLN